MDAKGLIVHAELLACMRVTIADFKQSIDGSRELLCAARDALADADRP